jgi:hypothetical protein
MQLAVFHFIAALFSAGLLIVGRYWRSNPASFVRFFTFGVHEGSGVPGKLGRLAGWFFFIFGSLGVLFYLILLPFDLVSSGR